MKKTLLSLLFSIILFGCTKSNTPKDNIPERVYISVEPVSIDSVSTIKEIGIWNKQ